MAKFAGVFWQKSRRTDVYKRQTYSFDLPESVSATVKSGSVVGTATVYLDGDEVGTVDLVTHREYVSDFRTDMKATALLLCALCLLYTSSQLPC